MKQSSFDPNALLETVATMDNMAGLQAFDVENPENHEVRIIADESVGPGMFKPSQIIPGTFLANSLTIRAMRRDIFVLGESISELETLRECACGNEIDLQFWQLCPFCARAISP